jgi:hypothetical protein
MQHVTDIIREWLREFINEADQAGLSYEARDAALRMIAFHHTGIAIVCLHESCVHNSPISRPENGNCP